MMVQVSFLKSTTRFLLWAFLCTCLVFYFQEAYSHSGGTDSSGGHYDRKNGGYHSHRGTPSSPSSGGGIKNKTPLHLAAIYGHKEAVVFLVEKWIDPRVKHKKKRFQMEIGGTMGFSPSTKADITIAGKTSRVRDKKKKKGLVAYCLLGMPIAENARIIGYLGTARHETENEYFLENRLLSNLPDVKVSAFSIGAGAELALPVSEKALVSIKGGIFSQHAKSTVEGFSSMTKENTMIYALGGGVNIALSESIFLDVNVGLSMPLDDTKTYAKVLVFSIDGRFYIRDSLYVKVHGIFDKPIGKTQESLSAEIKIKEIQSYRIAFSIGLPF